MKMEGESPPHSLVAQWLEQKAVNFKVRGSNPRRGARGW